MSHVFAYKRIENSAYLQRLSKTFELRKFDVFILKNVLLDYTGMLDIGSVYLRGRYVFISSSIIE